MRNFVCPNHHKWRARRRRETGGTRPGLELSLPPSCAQPRDETADRRRRLRGLGDLDHRHQRAADDGGVGELRDRAHVLRVGDAKANGDGESARPRECAQPGDQLVRVHVEVPTHLTAEQRKKLEDFALASGDADEPVGRTFFEKAKKFF